MYCIAEGRIWIRHLDSAYPPFGGAVSIYGDPLNPIQIGAKKRAGSPDRLYQSLGYRMSIWYPPKRDAAYGGPYDPTLSTVRCGTYNVRQACFRAKDEMALNFFKPAIPVGTVGVFTETAMLRAGPPYFSPCLSDLGGKKRG